MRNEDVDQPVTYVFLHELAGHIAMWAVRQSPYLVPDNLEIVLLKFQAVAWKDFAVAGEVKGGMRAFKTRGEIIAYLEAKLFSIAEFAAWNDRKNKREGPGFVTSFDGPRDPDDDFIDLYALAQNVAAGLISYEADCKRLGREPIEALIDRSSLGSPEAKAIRADADPAAVADILRRTEKSH
jgi:hypothetical protein